MMIFKNWPALILALGLLVAGGWLVTTSAGLSRSSDGTTRAAPSADTDQASSVRPNSQETSMVAVHVFNQQGELVGPIESPQVKLTDAQWQQRLTPEQFVILRAKGTERPFCGTLLDNKKQGVYCCAGCGLPLFTSDTKFHSGTGWPSFFRPIADGNVLEEEDMSHGMIRTEITCARCQGHLGHVFDDGPRPTGRRYCLNGESLKFTPQDQVASLADPAAPAR